MAEADTQHPVALMAFELIGSGRLPGCDAMTGVGEPCWSLMTILRWLRVDLEDFLQVLPEPDNEARLHGDNGLYELQR